MIEPLILISFISLLCLHLIALISSDENMKIHTYKKYYFINYNHVSEIYELLSNFNTVSRIILTAILSLALYTLKLFGIPTTYFFKGIWEAIKFLTLKKD